MSSKPEISVIIPNYNYGVYLANCFDSILAQTYHNIEVIFRDNNSTDSSMDIAMEYYKKFKEKGIPFLIANNRYNVGSDQNTNMCLNTATGKYIYVLASDDYIAPRFLERCVSVLEKYPTVSMVMTHRVEVDEKGNLRKTPPFYNRDCIIRGEDQAVVFMMAGIAVPCQRMVNTTLSRKTNSYIRVHNVAGDWYNNFLNACSGDIAYIKEPLCYYRVHSGNETSNSEDNLVGSFEHYLLLDSFVNISTAMGMKKPQIRYDDAIKKLGSMCLRYAMKMYENEKNKEAKRYLRLALVYDENIENIDTYQELWNMREQCGDILKESIHNYKKKFELNRTTSYAPPEGSIEI